ncbi:Allantoicase [Malassezia cuniculi]|uniref:Allantoicase n=1 Tax=Malassezia cuniculi TaxID=948313 RepID=A0AAF0EXL7_9BASI|nr:Allantoicase [Malassezia cuniculi]
MSFESIEYDQLSSTLGVTSVELSSSALGGKVLGCSDEWFAEATNLIKPHPAESLKGQFGPNGALYDGWETRRHNPTYDWAMIRLGPSGGGRITGFDIDTTTFSGNEGPAAAVYGMDLANSSEVPGADDDRWELLLPKVPCGPFAHHVYAYSDPAGTQKKYTHILLHMIPDGGFSRFRVYGVVSPAPIGHGVSETAVPDHPELNTVDLVHVLNGGRVVFTNDQHFGIGPNILLPGRGVNMGDGWETKRSRTPNHYDWVVVKLAEPGVPDLVEIDTIHFLGNFPESFVLDGCNYQGEGNIPQDHDTLESPSWIPLTKRSKLGPGKQHYFSVLPDARKKVFTHVRLTIFPDGGIKRLRLIGRRAAALESAGITTPEQLADLPETPTPN